jgi:hypothetical protein
MQVMRIGQFIHLTLILAVASTYAILKSVLPPDDSDRTRIDAAISVLIAVWGALVFIELLRGDTHGKLRERVWSAYRRLLSRPSTLLASNCLLAALCGAGICLLVLYRSVDF